MGPIFFFLKFENYTFDLLRFAEWYGGKYINSLSHIIMIRLSNYQTILYSFTRGSITKLIATVYLISSIVYNKTSLFCDLSSWWGESTLCGGSQTAYCRLRSAINILTSHFCLPTQRWISSVRLYNSVILQQNNTEEPNRLDSQQLDSTLPLPPICSLMRANRQLYGVNINSGNTLTLHSLYWLTALLVLLSQSAEF